MPVDREFLGFFAAFSTCCHLKKFFAFSSTLMLTQFLSSGNYTPRKNRALSTGTAGLAILVDRFRIQIREMALGSNVL